MLSFNPGCLQNANPECDSQPKRIKRCLLKFLYLEISSVKPVSCSFIYQCEVCFNNCLVLFRSPVCIGEFGTKDVSSHFPPPHFMHCWDNKKSHHCGQCALICATTKLCYSVVLQAFLPEAVRGILAQREQWKNAIQITPFITSVSPQNIS